MVCINWLAPRFCVDGPEEARECLFDQNMSIKLLANKLIRQHKAFSCCGSVNQEALFLHEYSCKRSAAGRQGGGGEERMSSAGSLRRAGGWVAWAVIFFTFTFLFYFPDCRAPQPCCAIF